MAFPLLITSRIKKTHLLLLMRMSCNNPCGASLLRIVRNSEGRQVVMTIQVDDELIDVNVKHGKIA